VIDAPRRVAVTGAAGRLGRVLVDRLAREPGIEQIVALDVRPAEATSPKVEVRVADVRDAALAGQLRGCDALVHLAFIVERGSRDGSTVESVNVGGTMNVIGAAAAAGVNRVVHASSIAAYGFHPDNRGRVLAEDQPLRGNDDFYYARTKAACERWLDGFAAEHPDIAVARLRPSVFMGPRGLRHLGRLFDRPVFPYLGGAAGDPLHVTHEEDVAEAFALALLRRARGAYNVATDEPLPLAGWAAALGKPGLPLPAAALRLADWAYQRGRIDVDPVWFRIGQNGPILVSNAKIRRELRWQPRWPTTGAVLRALAERPTAAASRGTRILFGSLATLTRVRGELPLDARARAEMKAFSGVTNILLTGAHPSEWHVRVRDGRIGIYPGLDPGAGSSTTLDEAIFFDLLGGRLSLARANMTGQIRHRGEGHASMLVGGIVAGFRMAAKANLPMRAFSHLVLRTGPATQERT
jgi:nucleoside-diphosphate-sugar epimerase